MFPSEILFKTDEEVLNKLHVLFDKFGTSSIECIVGLQNAKGKFDKSTLLIIDECDYEVLDQDVELPWKKADLRAVIGLSATLPQQDQVD